MVAPGIKNGLELRGTLWDRKIAKKFSEFFFITFSRESTFKSYNYVFNFLKPTGRLKESFNLNNEVLLLMVPTETFESRTLDFVDKTFSEFENRLDKICVLLISSDPKIESKIQKLNNENKDSRVIIPYTYDEILDNSFEQKKLENKFRKYFYNRDLFALESPLRNEAYFYGRNKVVQLFYDKYNNGEHSGLFGLRKTGKTSVLFALERMIKLRGGNSVYIDCQNPSIHKLKWNEFLHEIVVITKEKYELEVEISPIDRYRETEASKTFRIDISKIKKELSDKRILLIFDEIEYITYSIASTEHWKNNGDYLSFWQTLRSICQMEEGLFSFIIAGVNPSCVEHTSFNDTDNPLFSLIVPVYLDLFSATEVEEMVREIGKYMGLNFDKEIFTDLTDNYGGHPFLIRHVCSLLNKSIVEDRPYTVSKYHYRSKKQEFDKRLHDYVKMIISTLELRYPEEYELLETLVVNGNQDFKRRIECSDTIIEHLLGYGILAEENNEYYIKIDSLKEYILKKTSLRKKPDTKEEKWQVINSGRNKLEEKLRSLIITVMKAKHGQNAKDKVLEIVPEDKRKNLMECELPKLFSKHLFLSDLGKIILKNWTDFEKIFNDKTKFETYISFINKNRVDAHANEIGDDDMGIIIIAINWFEDKLKDFA